MWKFQDVSVIQIFREIYFGESRNSKTAVFSILEALNFMILVNFSLSENAKINKNQNPEPLKWQFLDSPK